MKNLGNYLISPAFLESLAMLAIMAILLVLIKQHLIKRVAYKVNTKAEQKRSTFIGVVFSVLQYVVILVTIFTILSINGVNVTGMLAGIGIVATIVGLSLQDTLKDILNGLNIYNNNFYKVGDIVRYNSELCEVKYFNARVTKFKSLFTNSTYTVPNSSIGAVEKVKDASTIIITFPFKEDHNKIMKALTEGCEAAKKVEGIKGCFVAGCIDISMVGNKYIIVVKSDAMDYFNHCTEVYASLIAALKKNGVEPVNEHHLHIEEYKED